jgi:hypothetical protein
LTFNDIEGAHYGAGPLGHDKLDTTARYTRVATGMIANIKSPLDQLSQPRKKPGKKPDTGEKDLPPA